MDALKQKAAAARAAWLADLARAIDDAQKLAWRIGAIESRSSEALELYVQLEAARLEVEALRGGGRCHGTGHWRATESDGVEAVEAE